MAPGPSTKLLDVANQIVNSLRNYQVHGDTSALVTLLDINPKMLEVGKQRFAKTPYNHSKH
jgi:2-methoxy-6-polyprenyl-1,4-benzoquinol methylase